VLNRDRYFHSRLIPAFGPPQPQGYVVFLTAGNNRSTKSGLLTSQARHFSRCKRIFKRIVGHYGREFVQRPLSERSSHHSQSR
jgi:hypothetical protein